MEVESGWRSELRAASDEPLEEEIDAKEPDEAADATPALLLLRRLAPTAAPRSLSALSGHSRMERTKRLLKHFRRDAPR
eukprot:6203513-Pleurochrysis_carterae.AAC.2